MQVTQINRVGGVLAGLTVASYAVGEQGGLSLLPVLLILAITLVKGWQVVDTLMALRRVRGPFRWLVLGWLAVVLGVIGVAFILGHPGL